MRFILLFLLINTQIFASEINFIQNDLSLARTIAQDQDKLILVKFHAVWCVTCQIMDESTWIDPRVIKYVEDNCVATQIDYDNIDGISYRNFFKVERLPTLLILDACGNEVARFENGANSELLLQWMALFNTPVNRVCEDGNSAALPINYAKAEPIAEEPEVGETYTSANNPILTKLKTNTNAVQVSNEGNYQQVQIQEQNPYQSPNPNKKTESAVAPQQTIEKEKWKLFRRNKKNKATEPAVKENTEVTQITPEVNSFSRLSMSPEEKYEPEYQEVTENNEYNQQTNVVVEDKPKATISVPVLQAASISTNANGNKRMVFEMPSKGFSVQVLATNSEAEAEKMKQYCIENFQKPVAIIVPTNDSYYRVVVGMYDQRTEANKSKLAIRSIIKDAFVRDLSK
jgi:septal ring-binding cell division protein DamX